MKIPIVSLNKFIQSNHFFNSIDDFDLIHTSNVSINSLKYYCFFIRIFFKMISAYKVLLSPIYILLSTQTITIVAP